MKNRAQIRLPARWTPPAPARWPDRHRPRSLRRASRDRSRLSRRRCNDSSPCSTNSVRNCRICGRQPGRDAPHAHRPVAQRMAAAVAPYADRWFITPMAAVAGAVAEEILAAMTSAAHLDRAYVNDGGDIALHLEPADTSSSGMVDNPEGGSLFGSALLEATQPVRGIATSGWRGRSFSLGIADAVTVLADRAAMADAAATIIANAVDLPGHPSITRVSGPRTRARQRPRRSSGYASSGATESHDVDQALDRRSNDCNDAACRRPDPRRSVASAVARRVCWAVLCS